MNVLITGMMQVGKSTLCNAVIKQVKPPVMCGFRTVLRDEQNRREGFALTTWQGTSQPFALPAPGGVGSYHVDLQVFNTLGVDALNSPGACAWCVIDELGVMEQQAELFAAAVQDAWKHATTSLFVIQQRALPFWKTVLDLKTVEHQIVTVTQANRDEMRQQVLDVLSR